MLAIGAATLADIFDPAERGTKMGVYYIAPLLGPSLGPIFGGVLTTGFDWRAPFWFLAIFAGMSFLAFLLFFKDTFRRERSLTYQNVLRRRLREQALEQSKGASDVTVSDTTARPESAQGSVGEQSKNSEQSSDPEKKDLEAQDAAVSDTASERPPVEEIKLSLMDVNPLKPLWFIIRRRNNIAILFPSGKSTSPKVNSYFRYSPVSTMLTCEYCLMTGLLFAFSFIIVYTCSRTLGTKYNYNALKIGFVLLAYGLGEFIFVDQ